MELHQRIQRGKTCNGTQEGLKSLNEDKSERESEIEGGCNVNIVPGYCRHYTQRMHVIFKLCMCFHSGLTSFMCKM